MTSDGCTFPREWLVAFRDGELKAAQLEITEVHLRSCPACRRWVDAMSEVDRLLHDSTPYLDNPYARAEIKARALAPAIPGRPFGSMAARARRLAAGRASRLAIGVVALLILLVGVSPWREPIAGAGSTASQWIRQGDADQPSHVATFPSPVIIRQSPLAALDLPLGLVEVSRADGSGDPVQHQYRNDAGLTISYAAGCPGASYLALPEEHARSEIAGVDGVDVRVFFGATHDHVSAMFWTDNNLLHSVLVLADTEPPLSLDEALRIAAALMHIREGGVAPCDE
jgi:hypothetical protein